MVKCVRKRKATARLQKCWLCKRAHTWTCLLAKVDTSLWEQSALVGSEVLLLILGWVWWSPLPKIGKWEEGRAGFGGSGISISLASPASSQRICLGDVYRRAIGDPKLRACALSFLGAGTPRRCDSVSELMCIKHRQLLTGATEGSQGSAHGRRGELFQCGFAKNTSCAARRAGGPGAQGMTAGTALAQWPPQTAFVERWEKSAPGLSAWCCHLVQTPHHSYAVSELYFFTFILWDGWGVSMSGLLAWASEFSGKM